MTRPLLGILCLPAVFSLNVAAAQTPDKPPVQVPVPGGCQCPPKPVLKKAVQDAAMVIVGRVLEQRPNSLKPGYTEVKVTPLQKFKDAEGFNQDPLTLYTPEAAEKCGYSFHPGFEYLIFITGNPAFYQANNCSRTEVLENAQVDIHRLQRIKEQPLEDTDPAPAASPTPAGKGKGPSKGKGLDQSQDLPPPRDALEEAMRKRNLLTPDALKRKSRL